MNRAFAIRREGMAAAAFGLLAKCGMWGVLAGVLLAWGSAVARFSPWSWVPETDGTPIWPCALAYVVSAAVLVVFLRRLARRMRPGAFVFACMGILLLGQCLLIAGADSGWRPTNDAAIFTSYLNHLAENGEGPESLGALSNQYDYRVWTRRAHPVYLALRKAAGRRFPLAVMGCQVLLSVLPMWFVWRMLRLLFGRNTAWWATIFQTVFPFRWIACLEHNHHLLGGLYFTVGLWVLVEYFRSGAGTGGWRKIGLYALACVLVPLMKLEGGIDWVYGVSVLAVGSGAFAAKSVGWRGLGAALAGLWFLPALAGYATTGPLMARIDAADLHHLESGAVAFMARGWVPETGGEYAYSHEVIDCLTPRELKIGVQKRLLASQLAYNGPQVFFRLFPTKLAKYFLLGFAAGAEEMLNANGAHAWVALAKGARIAFLLVVLPLVFLGGLWLLPKAGKSRYWPFVVPCLLLAAAYVCTGETSPRYSIYIQPLLFGMAGYGMARAEAGKMASPGWVREALPAAGVLSAGYLGAAALAIWGLAPRLEPFACLDARKWPITDGVAAAPAIRTKAPFVVELVARAAPEGTVWGPMDLPEAPVAGRDLVAYVFPGGSGARFRYNDVEATVSAEGDGPSKSLLRMPACMRIPAGSGMAMHRKIKFHAPFETEAPLLWGYAFWTVDQPDTDGGNPLQKGKP